MKENTIVKESGVSSVNSKKKIPNPKEDAHPGTRDPENLKRDQKKTKQNKKQQCHNIL